MTDYLPDMIAPPPEPEPALPENVHIPDNIIDKIVDDDDIDTDEAMDDRINQEISEMEDEPDEMLIPKKQKMSNDDIFKGPKIQPIKLSKAEMAEERRIAREAAKVAEKERKVQEKLLK